MSVGSPAEQAALERAISPDRLGTYQVAAMASGGDILDLYIWDRDLASAILADIAILEVALRNALNAALISHFDTQEWYKLDINLDDRSQKALAAAWNQLSKPLRTPGRLVSRLMFGFWVGLLDAGGYSGPEPQAFRRDYEQLFRTVLHHAFPGGRPEARAASAAFTREWVHGVVVVVQNLRNRAAHHEPLVGGFPLHGQRDRHGNVVRISAVDGHDACMRLARLLDRNLAKWLAANSAVPALLASRP
jgi:hypothetical protein